MSHFTLQDWIHNISFDVKGKSHTDRHRPLNAKVAAAMEITKHDAELQALCCGATW